MRCKAALVAAMVLDASCPVNLPADTQWLVSRWTLADGLPQSSPNALAIGKQGYLWVGTELGLARFDGLAFKVWDTRHGLPGERVVHLQPAPAGLYVATEPGALSLFVGGSFQPLMSGTRIQSLHLDPDGNLWVGTHAETYRVPAASPLSPRVLEGAPTGLFALTFGHGEIVAAHAHGISRRGSDGRWEALATGAMQLPVRDIERVDGQWWAAAANGFWRRQGDAWLLEHAGLSHGPGIARDASGAAWFWTRNAGLLRYRDGQLQAVSELGSGRNLVFSVLPDGPDTLWVGVADEGLLRLRRPLLGALTESDGLPMRAVHGVLEDRQGRLLLGSLGAGLARFDEGQVESLGPDEGLPEPVVMSMAESASGDIWIGMSQGLARLRDGRIESVPYPGDLNISKRIVSEIIPLPDRGVALVTGGGVYRVRDGAFTQLLPSGTVQGDQFLFRDRRGWLWAGGTNLCVLRPSGATCFDQRHGLPDSYLRFAYQAPDDRMWFGSYGGGLCAMLGEGQFRCISEEQGLPHRTVHNLLLDALGWLWIPSNRGLARLAPSELAFALHDPGYTMRADVFGPEHGLPDLEFNGGVPPRGVVMRDGRLALPTMNGLALVDPRAVADVTAVPGADIDALLVDGAELDPARAGIIAAGSDRLSFRYTAAFPGSPQTVRFRHRLQGHDPRWLAGEPGRTAVYTGLQPGRYRFEVQASAGSGPWSPSAVLPIRLLPHFWQTPWFVALVIFACTLLAAWLYRMRVRRLLELERMRLRIATDLHDELGSELSGISLASALLEDAQGLSEPTRSTLGDIRASVSHLLPRMRDIVWLIDPEKDRVGPLVQRLRSIAESMSAGMELQFTSNAETLRSGFSMAQRRDLLLLFRELMTNVARHAGAQRVRVRVDVRRQHLELEVSDDGRGFDPQAEFDGAGLRNLRRRAGQLGAGWTLDSTPGQGTRALLRVPLTRTGRGHPRTPAGE